MGLLDTFRRSFGGRARSAPSAYLSIRGYGVEAIPLRPFAATHLDDGTVVFGGLDDGPARPELLLTPGKEPAKIGTYLVDPDTNVHALGTAEEGTTALVLPPGQRDAKGGMAAFQLMRTRANGWYIRTEAWDMPFPDGFSLVAQEHGDFELSAEGVVTLTVLGPFKGKADLPTPDRFAPADTTYANQGTLRHVPESIPWFEFGHGRGEAARVHRYYELIADPVAFTVYLLHVDTPADATSVVYEVTDGLAKGFMPVHHADGHSG